MIVTKPVGDTLPAGAGGAVVVIPPPPELPPPQAASGSTAISIPDFFLMSLGVLLGNEPERLFSLSLKYLLFMLAHIP